jgi:nucleotide-binding universal stress UspA family protein
MYQNILVPVDGSELSEAAVRGACQLAKHLTARLTFYHAKPTYTPTAIAGEALFEDASLLDAFRAGMDKRAQTILDAARQVAEAWGVACTSLGDECDAPYRGIIAAAEAQGCDLIFMASHGRRGVSALLLGSETQKVLTHCRIPVLVFR